MIPLQIDVYSDGASDKLIIVTMDPNTFKHFRAGINAIADDISLGVPAKYSIDYSTKSHGTKKLSIICPTSH